MYRPRRTKKDKNHSTIIKDCRELGMVVWDTSNIGGEILDIIVFWRGLTLPVEIKSEGNESVLTDGERRGIKKLKHVGIEPIIATSIDDIVEVFNSKIR